MHWMMLCKCGVLYHAPTFPVWTKRPTRPPHMIFSSWIGNNSVEINSLSIILDNSRSRQTASCVPQSLNFMKICLYRMSEPCLHLLSNTLSFFLCEISCHPGAARNQITWLFTKQMALSRVHFRVEMPHRGKEKATAECAAHKSGLHYK